MIFEGKITVKIKKAKEEDLKDILELQKLAYESEAEIYGDFSIAPLKQTMEEITEEFENYVFIKMINDEEKIIGSVRGKCVEKTCFIGKLIVNPDFQNQGIGKLLISEIERQFINADNFELFTGNKSMKNISLYEKLGFKIFKKERINQKLELVYFRKGKRNCKIQKLPKKELHLIKHLWEKLNQMHYQDSIYFKDHFQTFTFEKRCNDFSNINDENIQINVLIDSEKVVGYCIATIKKAVGEIESIYVDDEYRKEGFGKKLIEESTDWLKENKCKKIMVAVAHGHENVFDFYMKMAFYPRVSYLQLKE